MVEESKKLAEVGFSTGRYFLKVAGIIVAMEGDAYRGMEIPEEFLEPIPQDELETATIGGKPVQDMPVGIVRFFRGDRWTEKMLQFTADKINTEAENI